MGTRRPHSCCHTAGRRILGSTGRKRRHPALLSLRPARGLSPGALPCWRPFPGLSQLGRAQRPGGTWGLSAFPPQLAAPLCQLKGPTRAEWQATHHSGEGGAGQAGPWLHTALHAAHQLPGRPCSERRARLVWPGLRRLTWGRGACRRGRAEPQPLLIPPLPWKHPFLTVKPWLKPANCGSVGLPLARGCLLPRHEGSRSILSCKIF